MSLSSVLPRRAVLAVGLSLCVATAAQAEAAIDLDQVVVTASRTAQTQDQTLAPVTQERGHAALLRALDAEPLLQLDLRLGEASGAAVAIPLLRSACALHNGMATFAEAGVSDA
ncbi:nicotinate-nucleotide--dimethylbenzimidazole phosphoribosyltransferase [Xanthomonas axonopodis pv. vasculorum]|nr:nicotinate-nucleotide--dimethylbenzimidazole phosphoribosyltransferase [Xanthomonas axonopodis]PPV09191.1 hypothetical protein XavaCFBP5823_16345 [Xanthomonas axonopodis pv. vasculorum]QKD87457.1 hypothetical protein XAV_15170 [Xanthomonas axonopodis pv. vasculorum]